LCVFIVNAVTCAVNNLPSLPL